MEVGMWDPLLTTLFRRRVMCLRKQIQGAGFGNLETIPEDLAGKPSPEAGGPTR